MIAVFEGLNCGSSFTFMSGVVKKSIMPIGSSPLPRASGGLLMGDAGGVSGSERLRESIMSGCNTGSSLVCVAVASRTVEWSMIQLGRNLLASGFNAGTQPHIMPTLISTVLHINESEAYQAKSPAFLWSLPLSE